MGIAQKAHQLLGVEANEREKRMNNCFTSFCAAKNKNTRRWRDDLDVKSSRDNEEPWDKDAMLLDTSVVDVEEHGNNLVAALHAENGDFR